MDDDLRREMARQRLMEGIAKAIDDIQKVRVEATADGSLLCRKQFLQIAERHLDMARRNAQPACGPTEVREDE